LHWFFVIPVCGPYAQGKPLVWIGATYGATVDNQLPESEKNAEYQRHAGLAQAFLMDIDADSFTYLERPNSYNDRGWYEATLRDSKTNWLYILVPHTDSFESRTDGKLAWVSGSFAISAAVWLFMVLSPPSRLTPSRQNRAKENPPIRITSSQRNHAKENPPISFFEWCLRSLLPTREHYALPLLLDINILIYVSMVVSGAGFVTFDAQALLNWGANYRPDIHGVGVIRLFASQFVHGGLAHLWNNLIGLWLAGWFLKLVMGNGQIIATYLICGLCGSIASVVYHPATVSVGASGAILGMFGVLLVLLAFNDSRLIHVRSSIFRGVAFILSLNLILGALMPGIDNAAHVGGVAAGVVLGLMFGLRNRKLAVKSNANARLP